MIWNNIEQLEKLAKVIPYALIVLGFIVAISGQFIQAKIENRVTILKDKVLKDKKLTPPQIKAGLTLANDSKIFVIFESINFIPFSARWSLVTENNHVVSPIMLSNVSFHPTKEKCRWNYEIKLQKNNIRNDYIELRFKYISQYSEELNYPSNLKGMIIGKYKLLNGELNLLD